MATVHCSEDETYLYVAQGVSNYFDFLPINVLPKIIIVGKTCSGTSYISKKLAKNMNLKIATQFDNRPQREGEINGVHRYFFNGQIMEDILKSVIFKRSIIPWRHHKNAVHTIDPYSSTLPVRYCGYFEQELEDSDIFDCDVELLKQIIEIYPHAFTILLDVSDEIRKERFEKRHAGQTGIQSWQERARNDHQDYDDELDRKLIDLVLNVD